MSILQDIQNKLNAPKDQYNGFAKFNYRSAESILMALKPHLAEHKCSLILNDDMILIGDRYYVKATAILLDESMKEIASASAFAREELSLKGQQTSQITGGTSSYARKYALNGLFLIDDNKDADTQDNSNNATKSVASTHSNFTPDKVSASQVKLIQTRLSKLQDRETNETALKAHYKIDSWNDLPATAMPGLITWFEKKGV